MSTNPFRKSSSLKASGGIASPNPNPIPDPRGTSPGGLSLDTRVPNTVQKHVNFASPPAIPISPVSYPPSPESTRQEAFLAYPGSTTFTLTSLDYSRALASDPFAQEASDEDDGAIEQALANARVNNDPSARGQLGQPAPKEDAVRENLSRLATAPGRPLNNQTRNSAKDLVSTSKAMLDVDAFKRMLLTGDRSASSRDTLQKNHNVGGVPVSDSGSSADTASISQHSILETTPRAHDESPRTSDELDGNEAAAQRAALGIISERGEKRAPPNARRTKALKEPGVAQGSTAKFDSFIKSLSLPDGRDAIAGTPNLQSPRTEENTALGDSSVPEVVEFQRKTPPAVPLSRRKSQQATQKPTLVRSGSSRISVRGETEGLPSPPLTSTNAKAPPPPPARRPNSMIDRRPSTDVISIPEESDAPFPDAHPGLPHTTSYLKRLSQGLPPPIPPPRRGRGSSKSSVDSTRPTMASLGMPDAESSDGHGQQSERGLLADLAALQREVDAARAGAGQ